MQLSESVPVPVTLPDLVRFYPEADWVWIGVQLFTLAVPLVFLFSCAAARLRTTCDRVTGGRPIWTLVLFACVYLSVAGVVSLPVGYLADLAFIRAWNGPTPTTVEWLGSQAASLVRNLVLAVAIVWIPYLLLRRAPRVWWLLCVIAAAPLLAAALLTYQLLLTPLWTHYRPIQDPALAMKFEALAERCGVKNVPILVGGDDSTALGFPPFQRIVLADFTSRDLTAAEQTAAYAHELKHYLLDGWKGIGMAIALLAGGLWLIDILGRAAIHKFANRFGFSNLSDPASLPLVLFILTFSWLLVGLPVFNAVQRHAELEADRFALELTHENRGEALLQAHYSKYKLNEYYGFYRLWRANHPSQAERVRLANTYHPWDSGGALVYGHVCRMP